MTSQVFQMYLNELLAEYIQLEPAQNPLITGLSLDSRLVKPGDLFFARPSFKPATVSLQNNFTAEIEAAQEDKTDIVFFIKEAIEKGAVAVVIDVTTKVDLLNHAAVPIIRIADLNEKIGLIAAHFYQHPTRHLQVIGITGTNGKTSTTHFIGQALNEKKHPAAVIGTLGNGIIDQLESSALTTPDAITLQRLFAEFYAKQVRYVAMEVSSHSLHQHRVTGINFVAAGFTNLTRDHLDYHGTMEEYASAKRRLFSWPGLRYAIINMDDDCGQTWIHHFHGKLPLYAYSIYPNNKHKLPSGLSLINVRDVHYDDHGITATLHTPWGDGVLHNPCLIGHFNLSNLLLAATVLGILGLPLQEILLRLAKVRGVNGRLQAFGGGDKPLVVIDYAHTPDALEKVLRVLREHCRGRLWCVFGCGGDRDNGKRPLMGKIAEQYADQLVITDDNPRTEDPRMIINEILQGLSASHLAVVEHDRRRAIAHAISCAQASDVVLIAGKGHETYQIIGTDKQPFSDSLEVQLFLAKAVS